MSVIQNYEIIISTCDKYSDLWDANIYLLKNNWPDREAKAHLVTDRPSDKCYNDVVVIHAAGENKEITERLATALETITSPYILFTLDDYFLTKKINNKKIDTAIDFMQNENIDYVRLYPASKYYLFKEGAKPFKNYPGFYLRNISTGDYKVSLYPGLWKTEFMKKTLCEKQNAWQYEVALTGMAREFGARCAISNNNEFPFLDVIRKGKVLNRARRYFIKNPIYSSEREPMKLKDEFKIWMKTKLRRLLPESVVQALKRILKRHGHTFYS